MSDSAAGERLVLPRRSYAWESQNGLALLAATAVFGAIAWYGVVGDARVPLLLVAAGLGAYLGQVLAFRREQDSYRLSVDSKVIASTRDGETIDSVPWSRVTSVEFTGERFGNWGVYGPPGLAQVRCHVRGRRTKSDDPAPDVVGVAVGLPVFGRRGLAEVDAALREACEAHGVDYRSTL